MKAEGKREPLPPAKQGRRRVGKRAGDARTAHRFVVQWGCARGLLDRKIDDVAIDVDGDRHDGDAVVAAVGLAGGVDPRKDVAALPLASNLVGDPLKEGGMLVRECVECGLVPFFDFEVIVGGQAAQRFERAQRESPRDKRARSSLAGGPCAVALRASGSVARHPQRRGGPQTPHREPKVVSPAVDQWARLARGKPSRRRQRERESQPRRKARDLKPRLRRTSAAVVSTGVARRGSWCRRGALAVFADGSDAANDEAVGGSRAEVIWSPGRRCHRYASGTCGLVGDAC